MKIVQPGKKGSRKIGRDKKKCELYTKQGKREENKRRQAEKLKRKFEKNKKKRGEVKHVEETKDFSG